MRGLVLGEVGRATFKDILGASSERTLYSYRTTATGPGGSIGYMPGGGADVTVSVVVPNLLFDELELQKTREVPQKRPTVAAPPLKGEQGRRQD